MTRYRPSIGGMVFLFYALLFAYGAVRWVQQGQYLDVVGALLIMAGLMWVSWGLDTERD